MTVNREDRVPTEPMNVLHIDDDSSFLDVTASYVEAEVAELNVTTALGPTNGIEQLEQGEYHCIISDYEMPEQNGLELLERVRERYPDLPFILYTGKGSEEIAAEAINAGVTGYLQKGGPDQHQRLANRVRHAANEYQTQIESERYSTVLKALDYPIYVVDNNAEFEYINDAFLELVGYDREEIVGSPPGLIKTDDDVENADNILAEIVSSSGPDTRQFEVDIHTKQGDVVPCYDHMAALPFETEFRGSVGILRDRSREQQQREQLLEQNERLEQFSSIVSHDLRTPLSNAQTAAALAQSTGSDEAFSQLESALNRMEQMIDELLTLAREGQTISETETVDVAEIATEAWEPFCGAEDTLKLADTPITIDADRARFRQLLENLFRNAVEHSNSSVTVTVGQHDDGFYIADDGPGIDPADREKIFEPGHTTAEDGTGFGLTIVDRIARGHSWEVSATESTTGGARFEFETTVERPVSAE